MTMATPVEQLPLYDALPVEHLFDMHIDLAPAQPITTPLGVRMTFITTGGVIDGPQLQGEVLPGGGDWMLVGADRAGRVDVRDGDVLEGVAMGCDRHERRPHPTRADDEDTHGRTLSRRHGSGPRSPLRHAVPHRTDPSRIQ